MALQPRPANRPPGTSIDDAYDALFAPLGLTSATLQTDASGTWVASSYTWAGTADWARLGPLMLTDGTWNGKQVLPTGWWPLAGTSVVLSAHERGGGDG